MNPQNRHSLYKADAIEVALILGLPLPEADEFVTMISGEHLHWRSAKEIIYIYALQNGLRYPELPYHSQSAFVLTTVKHQKTLPSDKMNSLELL